MSETYQRISRTHVRDDAVPADDETVHTTVIDDNPGITSVQLLIQYLTGVISSLLLIRFALALFGANESNAFVNFLYSITNPLVAPFRGIFSIDTTSGITRFEVESLVATIVYVLAGLGIIRLLDIFRSR